nr:hypothetical protein [Tanacetum cinerariifolium]
MCDVPFHDNSPPLDVSKDQFEDFSESNDEFSLTDDDSFSIDKIDYVEASPPDYELVSSETKSSSTSLNSLLEKTNTFDNSLPESDTLCFDVEEISSGSTTTRFDISLPAYEASYDDQSFSDEDVSEKIFLKPLFEEEIIPMKIYLHPDNVESDLMESLCTHDSSLIISSKIDSLLDEFADELALLKSIPPGIDETDCDPEEDIRLIERFLYDKSSPRPPEEFIFANSDTEYESFSPSPILVKDSDSLMKEIDLSCTPDYPMPPGIKDDDYDSERDILILKDLPSNDTLSIPEIESFLFDIPSFSRPPATPPDDEFAGELTLLKSIPPGIDETDCDPEEYICLIERSLYDNSSPRPLEEIVSANSDTEIESFSPSPIPVKDSDSLMEEIDLSCTPN